VTSDTCLAAFFGGPDDGATKSLTADDLVAGFVDTHDSLGTPTRYSIVPLPEPAQIDDLVVTHRLLPQEGVW
jgi:hypothetical protein